jgi:hypothetical protein
MQTQYVLVDFENVQPKDLVPLKDGPYRVRLFLGPNQTKIPLSLATSMQDLGRESQYVALEAAGSNAVDFMIAYTLGKLAAQEPTASFHIISKDGGFDPMITQLRRQGLTVDRSISIALMPCQQKTEPTTDDERLACLRAQFQRHPANRPKTEKALQGRIRTHFRQHLDDEGVAALIERMRTLGLIALTGGKVSYSLSELASEVA